MFALVSAVVLEEHTTLTCLEMEKLRADKITEQK